MAQKKHTGWERKRLRLIQYKMYKQAEKSVSKKS
jgi:hypothetical protein